MSSSPERIALLERDLRAAARAFDDVPVSADAWQQNQQRLAAGRGRHGRTLLAVAAALVLVVAVGALLFGGGNSGNRTMPAGGGDDPFGDSVVLGPPMDVETLNIDGVATTHQAVLSDQTGKGPSLCDRYVTSNNEVGSCNSRDPNADDPDVAFDWLTATVGGGDIRGVLAGVDSRVMKVQIWMDNGDMTLADLKPGGWEDTKLFALTVPADGPRPQRLVAYSNARGTWLQSIDLAGKFGNGWLPESSDCANENINPMRLSPQGSPADVVEARVTSTTASLHVKAQSIDATSCLPLLSDSLSGVKVTGRVIALLVGPEVERLRVRTNSGVLETSPQPVPGTSWRLGVLRVASPDDLASAQVTAFDGTDDMVTSVQLSELRARLTQD
jgi:hypothetical protein